MLVAGARLAVRRGLRLIVNLTLAGAWGALVVGRDATLPFATVIAVGVALWVPATAIQARILFFPAPPDPWLTDGARQLADRDARAWARSEVAEEAVSSVLPLSLIAWLVARAPIVPRGVVAVGVAFLAVILVSHLGRRLAALVVHEASLDLAAGADPRLLWLVDGLARTQVFGQRTSLAYVLARARFRRGDVDGALAVLDRLPPRSRRDAWVDVLRVQMAIVRDGTGPARVLAAELAADPDKRAVAAAIEALADLHDGRPEVVIAARDHLLALPEGEGRRFSLLLLAAALAPADPHGAARALASGDWDLPRALALARPWPAVGDRLRLLGG